MSKKKFEFRAFSSLAIFLTFLLDAVSGLILYLVPSGSEARWNNWRFLGLSKDGWISLHTVFSFFLLLFAVIHMTKNWKSILFYLKCRVKKYLGMGLEFLLAAVLMLLVLAGTILNVPPFSQMVDWGGNIQKGIWPGSKFKSIDSHPERLSFDEFFQKAGVPPELALQRLKKRGVLLENTGILLEEFIRKRDLSPADIYAIIISEN